MHVQSQSPRTIVRKTKLGVGIVDRSPEVTAQQGLIRVYTKECELLSKKGLRLTLWSSLRSLLDSRMSTWAFHPFQHGFEIH